MAMTVGQVEYFGLIRRGLRPRHATPRPDS